MRPISLEMEAAGDMSCDMLNMMTISAISAPPRDVHVALICQLIWDNIMQYEMICEGMCEISFMIFCAISGHGVLWQGGLEAGGVLEEL